MSESIANDDVPEDHVKTLEKNVKNMLKTKLAGKTERSLSSCVSHREYGGKGPRNRVIDYLGPVEFVERKNSSQDIVLQPGEHTIRWVSRRKFDLAILANRLDDLKNIHDPTSPYSQRIYEAAVRKMDEVIMDAFFATAETGINGTTDTKFNDKNVIPKTNSGLTIQQLWETKKRHIGFKKTCAYIVVTADDLDNLFRSAVSTAGPDTGAPDVNIANLFVDDAKRLVEGKNSSIMGLTVVPYEGVYCKNCKNENIRKLPVWVSDGMHLGIWQWPEIEIFPRADKNNLPQVQATFIIGATRLDEDKVFQTEVDVGV